MNSVNYSSQNSTTLKNSDINNNKKTIFSLINKFSCGTFTAAILSSIVISPVNATAANFNVTREVRTLSSNSAYKMSSAVYTGKIVSTRSEAVHMKTKERPIPVEIEFENHGYIKHIINFDNMDIQDDEIILMANSSIDPISVDAEIDNLGYQVHYIHFEDEV